MLIGLSGAAGSGKSTAARYLADRYNLARLSFATPLREALVAILGEEHRINFTQANLKEEPIKFLGVSPRVLMQTLGTEWGRKMIHPDMWVILAAKAMREAQDNGARGVVFDDVRFPNEEAFIQTYHGIHVHIARNGAATPHAHVSEQHDMRQLADVILENNGTEQQLFAQLDQIFGVINGDHSRPSAIALS